MEDRDLATLLSSAGPYEWRELVQAHCDNQRRDVLRADIDVVRLRHENVTPRWAHDMVWLERRNLRASARFLRHDFLYRGSLVEQITLIEFASTPGLFLPFPTHAFGVTGAIRPAVHEHHCFYARRQSRDLDLFDQLMTDYHVSSDRHLSGRYIAPTD